MNLSNVTLDVTFQRNHKSNDTSYSIDCCISGVFYPDALQIQAFDAHSSVKSKLNIRTYWSAFYCRDVCLQR